MNSFKFIIFLSLLTLTNCAIGFIKNYEYKIPKYNLVENFRINVPYGKSQEVKGLNIGLINESRKIKGIQGGLYNLNRGGKIYGLQLAGLNSNSDVEGLQLGIVNLNSDTKGFQVGFINKTREFNGFQIGGLNGIVQADIEYYEDPFNGLQVGGVSRSGKLNGLALGMLMASAYDCRKGVLLSIFSVSDAGCKFQFGLINISGHKSNQIGLINYSKNNFFKILPFVNFNFSKDDYEDIGNFVRAIEVGNIKAVEKGLNEGIDKDTIVHGRPPVLVAIKNKQADVLKVLVERGVNLETEWGSGEKPLTEAIKVDSMSIVSMLVNKVSEEQLFKGLYTAIEENNLPLLEIITNTKRIDITDTDKSHTYTLLSVASKYGYTEIVKFLIQNKVSINGLFKTCSYSFWEAIERGHIDVAEILIQNGARDACSNDRTLFSPLRMAIKTPHIEMIQMLLKNKIKVSQGDIDYANSLKLLSGEESWFWTYKTDGKNGSFVINEKQNMQSQEKQFDCVSRYSTPMYENKVKCQEIGSSEIYKNKIDEIVNLLEKNISKE
jgi:ankyrin repeat protein